MPTEIPDLWGDDFDVDVVPPLVILRAQAEAIGRRTKGMLTADVVPGSRTSGDGQQEDTYTLLLQAPSIGYHGEQLLELSHDSGRYYPARIDMPIRITWASDGQPLAWRFCNDQEELLDAIHTALTSPPTKAALNSLLAKVNEKREPQK